MIAFVVVRRKSAMGYCRHVQSKRPVAGMPMRQVAAGGPSSVIGDGGLL
jgi:hypothetical protein